MLLYYPFHGPESEWKVIASGNGRKQVTASRACRRAAFAILIPSSNWSFSSSAVLRPHSITTPSLSAQIYQACKNPLQQVVFQWAALNTPLFWPLQNGPVKTVQGSIQDLLPAKLREGMSWMIRMLLLVFLTQCLTYPVNKTAPSDCDRAFAHWLRTELPLLGPRHYAIWIQSWNQSDVLDPILTSRKVWPQCHLDCGTEWGRFLYAE